MNTNKVRRFRKLNSDPSRTRQAKLATLARKRQRQAKLNTPHW